MTDEAVLPTTLSIKVLPSATLQAQLNAALDKIPPDGIKVMLTGDYNKTDKDVMLVVAKRFGEHWTVETGVRADWVGDHPDVGFMVQVVGS